MRLKAILVLLAVYAVTAAPEFLPGEWRVIIQPATDDAVEVYCQPVSSLPDWYAATGPFSLALQAAERRAETYPHDLAPPYLIYEPFQLIAPYVTPRGRELASQPISGLDRRTPYRIVPRALRVRNSQAALTALMQDRRPGGLRDEPEALAGGITPEVNRVTIQTNTFSQDLRRRLARRYGGLVAIEWAPFAQRPHLLSTRGK